MDNGEVIPGLNEPWTFAGAKVMEWVSGFVMFMVVSELFGIQPGKAMPILLAVWFTTTLGLASLRRRFPDEERGVRNVAMVALGFPPPGIPAPAAIEPLWSGAPMREVPESTYFSKLGLDRLFPSIPDDDEEFEVQ